MDWKKIVIGVLSIIITILGGGQYQQSKMLSELNNNVSELHDNIKNVESNVKTFTKNAVSQFETD